MAQWGQLWAGMTGGMAYVYDPDNSLETRMNAETGSLLAAEMLRNRERIHRHFKQVCPKKMLGHLPQPLSNEADEQSA